MKMLKALFGVLAGAAMLASAPAHATRIVVITHGQASDAFWSVVKNGVDDAGALMGVEVQYQAPQTFDMVAMKQLIDAAVASQPDGLVVSIPDADALGDSIKAAVAAPASTWRSATLRSTCAARALPMRWTATRR